MNLKLAKLLGLLAALCLMLPALAQHNTVLEFSRPEYKERYYHLVEQFRCLVCQNQTIAESNAELAVDLRNRVHEMVEQGQSDDDIVNFMAERYGNFVLYNPPLKPSTMLLWFAPFIAIGIGSVALVLFIMRRNKDTVSVTDVSESVRRRVAELTRPKPAKAKTKGSKK
jgi:cytochrome c-type biogenesis protein CcmH